MISFSSFVRPTGRSASVLLAAVLVCGSAVIAIDRASAQSASRRLTNDQRRAYLHYYSPIILKKAHENDEDSSGNIGRRRGHDWITNFFFDGDRDFSNNRRGWQSEKRVYLQELRDGHVTAEGRSSSYPSWEIRPTLYTALLEFTIAGEEAGSRSLVLLYHVYHAMQGRDDVRGAFDNPIVDVPSGGAEIHDWERVEVRVDSVTGVPGDPAERINYVTVTKHGTHVTRSTVDPDAEITFHETSMGRHVVLWQAPHDVNPDGLGTVFSGIGPHYNELRFTNKSWSQIRSRMENNKKAKVEHRFHYVFVDEADTEAVRWWKAEAVDDAPLENSSGRSRGKDVRMDFGAKALVRLTYELQDIADILPTHHDDGTPNASWTDASTVAILMEDRVLAMDTCAEVSAPRGCLTAVAGGMEVRAFLRRARDVAGNVGASNGYPRKDWLWGTYGKSPTDLDYPKPESQFTIAALYDPALGRCEANGIAEACPDDPFGTAYFYQHDYFARHYRRQSGDVVASGRWLPRGWHTSATGGFDGRWVQLFADPRLTRKSFACGDATYDGEITAADALRIGLCAVGIPCGMHVAMVADVNDDGDVDALDMLVVMRAISGHRATLRCPERN
jgi:hypothetical protein